LKKVRQKLLGGGIWVLFRANIPGRNRQDKNNVWPNNHLSQNNNFPIRCRFAGCLASEAYYKVVRLFF